MHDRDDQQGGGHQSSQAPQGLRSTLPSRPASTTQSRPSAPSSAGYAPQAHAPAPGGGAGYAPGAFGQTAGESWPQSLLDRAVDHDDAAAGRRGAGLKNIVGGAVLIGIGLTFGGSIFLGNPTALDYAFDGLGTIWILKGIYDVVSA